MKERQGDPLRALSTFVRGVTSELLTREAIESLIKVGGFDQCEEMNRQTLLKCMEKVMAMEIKFQRRESSVR